MASEGTVTAFLLNVRNAPSLSGKAFTQIKRDTVVDILEKPNAEWAKIRLSDGRTGYVAIAYLNVKELASESAQTNFKVKITTPSLNVRAGAGTNYAVIGGVSENDVVEVLETSGDWYKINFNGGSGYIYSSYTERLFESFTVKITTSVLNVRAGAGTSYAILGTVKENDVYEILEVLGDWYRISFNGSSGYIYSSYTERLTEVTHGFLIEQNSLMTATLEANKVIARDKLEANSSEDIVARIWNDYGGLVQKLANYLEIPASTMVAVLAAESGGKPFADDGRLKIRFEVHLFYEYWGKNNQDTFDDYFQSDGWKEQKFRSDTKADFAYFHGDQQREQKVLAFARALSNDAALQSTSMGMPQIMGFNYAMLGYKNVQQMYDAFGLSVHAQILGMFDFVQSSGTDTIKALQDGNYLSFATIYNGAGNAETYSKIISKYASIYDKLIQNAQIPSDNGNSPNIPPIDVIEPVELELVAVPTVYLNFRNAPNGSRILGVLKKDVPVKILESKDVALKKLQQGQSANQWLYLENSDGQKGYAAAWLMKPLSLLTQEATNSYIDKIPNYVLPSGYQALWDNQEKLGLPDPFNNLPVDFSSQSEMVNLQVNGFGPNTFALWNWTSWYKNTGGMHNGVDYMIKAGTPILAVSDGVIIKNWIFLPDSREITTTLWCFLPEKYRDSQGHRMMSNVLVAYGHLSDNSQRDHKEVVKAGDVIASSGAPVDSVNNDHLHMEVHLLQGDTNLPHGSNRSAPLLSLYKRPQPMDNNTPHNPVLFFSPRVINYHLRQGETVGFLGQYPDYPTLAMMEAEGVEHLPVMNQLTLAYYRYGIKSIWQKPDTGTWPEGVVTTDMLAERIKSIAAFEPYEATFL